MIKIIRKFFQCEESIVVKSGVKYRLINGKLAAK